MLKDENIGFLIGRVRRGLRREFDNKFTHKDITPAQYDLISRLWRKDGLYMTELSKGIYKDGPTVTGLVDRLEKKKLLVRKKDNKDRRAIRIFLTKKGKDLKGELSKLADEILKKAIRDIAPHEMDKLKILLNTIGTNLEK